MTPRPIDPPALAAAGGHYSHAVVCNVQVRVHVNDIAHWPAFNAIYAEWDGAHRPARAVVPVPQLHFGSLSEVEAIGARVRINF